MKLKWNYSGYIYIHTYILCERERYICIERVIDIIANLNQHNEYALHRDSFTQLIVQASFA